MSGRLDDDELDAIRDRRADSTDIAANIDRYLLIEHINALQAELDYANEQQVAWAQLAIRHDGEMYEAGTRHAIQEYVGLQQGLQQAVSGEWVDVDELTEAIERVRSLHQRQELSDGYPYCEHCTTNYPCRTIKALDGTP